jgi:DNA polymerase I
MSKKKEHSKGRIFVCDGNWYLHRCFHVIADKTSRPLEEVLPQAFLSMVLKDAVATKCPRILVAFDGRAVFRYDVYPEYKASRSEASKQKREEEGYQDVYSCLPQVRKLFAEMGIALVQHKKYEADDVWASSAKQYVEQGYEVVGGCKDKDGFQALGPRVRMYDSSAKPEPKFMDAAKAEKVKGVPVSKMIMLQTLIGDGIDDIPSVISLAKAKAICNKYDTVKSWFEDADPEMKRFIRSKQVQLTVNRQLVMLKTDLALPDPSTLLPPKQALVDKSKWWYAHQDLCYPKSKGLFRK